MKKMVEERQAKQVKLSGEQIVALFQEEKAKLDSISMQINSVQTALTEVLFAEESLKELSKEGFEGPILVNLGSGVFIEGAVSNAKKLKKSLPGNVVLDVSPEEVSEELKKRKENAQKTLELLLRDRERIYSNLNNLSRIINAVQAQAARSRKR
ncbi:MAG: hypothetical protein AB1467_00070 [Candidatus Diapherotrites archaeon]